MTGVVFASLSKFIEIGNIVSKYKNHNPETLMSPIGNKRQIKQQQKQVEKQNKIINSRNIKHYATLQTQPIYYPDIEYLKNRIMMNIGVPNFWHLEAGKTHRLIPSE